MRISDWSSDVCSSDLKKSLFLRRIWQKKPEISKTVKQGVRIPPAPPVRYKVWHAPNRRAYAVGGEHPQQVALAAHDPDLALVHFDPLRERAKMIAPIAAALKRSEEHTSELQSLMRPSYAVFCLNKKKSTKKETLT